MEFIVLVLNFYKSMKMFLTRDDANIFCMISFIFSWGLAYYHGHGLRQFHDTEAASTSLLAQFLGQQESIQTRNMMAHIRYATSGSVDLANVHPFSRE